MRLQPSLTVVKPRGQGPAVAAHRGCCGFKRVQIPRRVLQPCQELIRARPAAAAAAGGSSATTQPPSQSPSNGNGSSSSAGAPQQAAAAAVPPASFPMPLEMRMQMQMQQQMQQMSAMMQAIQQQNLLLFQQVQQMQQQLAAVQTPAAADTAAAAAAAPSIATPVQATVQTEQATNAPPPAAAAAAAQHQEAAAVRDTAQQLIAAAAAARVAQEERQPAAAAAAAAGSFEAAATQAREQLTATAAAARAAREAQEVAAAGSSSSSSSRGIRKNSKARKAEPDSVTSSRAAKPAAAAAAVGPRKSKTGAASSSSSRVNVKAQLEQLQKMNAVMAQLLAQQQQQQQQQQAPAALPTPPPPIAAAAAAEEQKLGEQQQQQQPQPQPQPDVPVVQLAAETVTEGMLQQPQQPPQQPLLSDAAILNITPETAAAAAAALEQLKQLRSRQQQQQRSAAAPANAAAAPATNATPAAAAAAAQSSSSSSSSSNTKTAAAPRSKDVLLQRITSSRSARELQQLFERQQQRLRPHHLAALVSRLPETNEGRTAVYELAAAARDGAAAAAAAGGGSSGRSAAVIAFADDLITMLQLQLSQLTVDRLLGVIEATAALHLSPRSTWIASFLAASQQKLSQLNPTQLASMAAAVAAVTNAAASPAAAAAAAAEKVQVSPGWIKSWLDCSKQQLLLLTKSVQQQQQTAAAEEMPGAQIGALAAAAVQVNALRPPSAAAAGSSSSRGPGALGPTTANLSDWTATLLAAADAATAAAQAQATVGAAEQQQQEEQGDTAAAAKSPVVTATAAANILHCLTTMKILNPGLLLPQQQGADSAAAAVAAMAAASRSMAAVAAAARGSMAGSSSSALMKLLQGLVAAGAAPDFEWLAEFCTALRPQLRNLTPSDSLAVLDAFSTWQQQQQQPGSSFVVPQQQQQLLGGLLTQTAAAAADYTPQQICQIISTLALRLGFKIRDQDQGTAVQTLLQTISHTQQLSELTTSQLVVLLKGLADLGLDHNDLDQGSVGMLQREGIRPRVTDLKPQQFADVARSVAALGVMMEYDVMDAFWSDLEDKKMKQLTDGDCVSLLSALGVLNQKPRAELLGAFLSHMKSRLSHLNSSQLSSSLQAMAQLKLTKVDTQGVRVITAQSAPTPQEFVSELLTHLNPKLAGPQGATAAELAVVLASLVTLGFSPDQTWLDKALEGVEDKLLAAVTAPGGEQVLVDMLAAVSQLSVQIPEDLLTVAVEQLQSVVDQLSAAQISIAMSALRRLKLDPDEKLMGSYLDRAAAAAAAGTAAARDMAAVLSSLAAAGVVPAAAWLRDYLAAAKPQLRTADSADVAAISRAAAALTAASSSSSSGEYSPDPAFVAELVAVANTRLGSSFSDASRILKSPDYKPPFTLQQLTDCSWGLFKLGAAPKQVQGLVNMMINKSYDRLSQLSSQQLAAAAWAIAYCSSSSSGSSKKGAAAAAVKLPSKWLNQFATAAAAGTDQLTSSELSDLIWALGVLYIGADHYQTSASSSGGSSIIDSSSSIGSSSAAQVQQMLRLVAAQLHSQLQQQQQQQDHDQDSNLGSRSDHPSSADISIVVNLLKRFDCSASTKILQRFLSDVADQWEILSDVAISDAAAAAAVMVQPGSDLISQEWLESLADQITNRLPTMHPQLRCRCIWALAALNHNPGKPWLSNFRAEALKPSDLQQLQPGDLSDALWAIYTLETLDNARSDTTSSSSSSSSLITDDLLQQAAKKLDRRVNELQPGQVLRLLQLAGGALVLNPEFKLPVGVSDQLSQVLSAKASVVAETTGVIGLLWSAAKLKLRLHISTLDQFCKVLYGQLDDLPAEDMAKAFWASYQLGYRWLPPQLDAFDRQAAAKLDNLSGGGAALLLEGFKRAGYSPSRQLLDKFSEMPVTEVLQLHPNDALQLAQRLTDQRSGVTPCKITWITDWARGLTGDQLKKMSAQQLCTIVQLMASSTNNCTSSSEQQQQHTEEALALLCWALQPHISSCNAEQVYCLVKSLATWRYVPPGRDVLLAAAAARLVEKLSVLSQTQVAELLCSFAQLGFTVGEPLDSRFCDKLMQAPAAASSSKGLTAAAQAAATARVLAAVLRVLPKPRPDVLSSLMNQIADQMSLLPPSLLLQLGEAMAAAGMGSRQQQQQPTAAAARRFVIPADWAKQYKSAVVNAMQRMSLADLAGTCSTMSQLGFLVTGDTAAADVVVQALQMHLAGSSSAVSVRDVAAVAAYVTDSGFRPKPEVMAAIEQQLLLALRSSSSSMDSGSSEGHGSNPVNSGQQQQQQQGPLDTSTLAQLLLNMNRWGRRPGSSFATAAYDWSRYQLHDIVITTLGPLLLGLTAVCGSPSSPWVLDWSAVVLEQLPQAGPDDLAVIAAAVAEVGSTDQLCSSTWMRQYGKAVQQQLKSLSEQQLETICSSLFRLRHRPDREWVEVVKEELQQRAPATDTPAARALAYLSQLKVAV